MTIGIDASRAFLSKRTGIEEYSYQVIKHLRDILPQEVEVVLYVRKKLKFRISNFDSKTNERIQKLEHSNIQSKFKIQNSRFFPKVSIKLVAPEPDFDLPPNWVVKGIWAPRFWTQIGLSLEMLLHRPDILFVPAHTVPLIHPKQTIVTVHGLEYEMCPESYSWYERLYMRWSIRFSVHAASQVIAVSENTKRDLVQLYSVPVNKIMVVYEGVERTMDDGRLKLEVASRENLPTSIFQHLSSPFLLFIGRLEERKNVRRIIEAFEYFKQKTKRPHQLILAGKPGYGHEKIKEQISKSKYQDEIKELGYVTEAEKWELLKKAEVFIFPSLYEGFGLPVIEAQSVGTPVITSLTSSLREIAGHGAMLVNPARPKEIGRALVAMVSDPIRRAGIIDEATRNVGRFSWTRCAESISKIFTF